MPFQSSEIPLVTRPASPNPDDGPVLGGPLHSGEGGDTTLCIRARRVYPVSREELFATWTRRTSWDVWMRLRARSRATLAPYRGGAFRLEMAEGPAIHVITGTVTDVRPPEQLSLSWQRQNTNDPGSMVEVSFRRHPDGTELVFAHTHITSRREAAWLMRLWSTVLGRLEAYLVEGIAPSARPMAHSTPNMTGAKDAGMRGRGVGASFARSA